jgi:exodeoxyribonuclease VII large subunit
MTAEASTLDKPWSVANLTAQLKAYIDRLGLVWVEGEITQISNGKMGRFGTLRDLTEETAMGFSIWASSADQVPAELKAGDRVIALAKVDFWKKNGDVKLVIQQMRHVGLGDLLEKLEQLRAKLAAEGLFALERKQPLPFLPARIGLITGADSDAEKDVLKNARLRWPAAVFEVRHTPVQGPETAPRVIAALAELDTIPEVEVIIIARGGGDFLNLLPFSEEALVRAVAACETPVVSAIGHEADRPLLDDVADLRASTPTDAGKRVVPDIAEELARVADARARIRNRVTNVVSNEVTKLEQLRSRPVLASYAWITDQRAEDILRNVQRGHGIVMHALDMARASAQGLRAQLRSLSPQQTLDRGYAIALTKNKNLVRSTADAPAGTELSLMLADGRLTATSTGAEADTGPQDNTK